MLRGPQRAATPQLRARLRRETAEVHQALEAELDLLAPDLSLGRYLRVLRGLRGYHAALEPRLARLNEASRLTFPLRARSALLDRDLRALGMTPEAVAATPPCDELPALTAPEHLAGCVYVLEGACLGGRVVSRALQPRLGLTSERGCAFFTDGGGDPAPRWASTLAWLERLAGRVDHDGAVASAVEVFQTLGRWLERRGATR
jgi:heme oxygenase